MITQAITNLEYRFLNFLLFYRIGSITDGNSTIRDLDYPPWAPTFCESLFSVKFNLMLNLVTLIFSDLNGRERCIKGSKFIDKPSANYSQLRLFDFHLKPTFSQCNSSNLLLLLSWSSLPSLLPRPAPITVDGPPPSASPSFNLARSIRSAATIFAFSV